MDVEETLNWMCREITFWYIEGNGNKEIIYPLTENKQKIVQNILNEDADVIIYKNKFYTLDKDIDKTINKTSYSYYMKESTIYKKRKAISILPYSVKDSELTIVKNLTDYYKNNNIPFLLVILDNFACLKEILSEILIPFTYINLSSNKLLLHKDIYVNVDNTIIILLADINSKKLLKKCSRLRKKVKKYELGKFEVIDDYSKIVKFLSTIKPIN